MMRAWMTLALLLFTLNATALPRDRNQVNAFKGAA